MSARSEAERISIMHEEASVDKVKVPTGKVTIRTLSEAHEQVVRETLQSEAIEVERVPIGTEVAAPPDVRTVDHVLIVPVLEERLVVEKRLFLVEELHIRRVIADEKVEVPVTLRKQRAVVQRENSSSKVNARRKS